MNVSTGKSLAALFTWIALLVGADVGFLAHVLVAQTVIHVAPNGDDTADGNAAHPLKTLAGALRRLRDHRAAGDEGWDRVELEPGNYTLDEPLVLTPGDSGESNEHPLIFTASNRGTARINGGVRIRGFQKRGNRWVASVPNSLPPFRDLWVNGRRAIRARSPNDGFFRIEAAGPDNRTSIVAKSTDFLSLAHPQSAEIVFLHDWSISRIRLASIDATANAYHFTDPIGAVQRIFAITNFEPHPRYFVENAPELLDVPGEWYLDAAARELHYLPRDGEDVATAEVVAPRLEQLLVLQGEGNKFVENIRFDGLLFCHAAFALPPHGYAGIQANWYDPRGDANGGKRSIVPAAASLDRTFSCAFTNCRFEHLGGAGLSVEHSQNTRVDRSTFSDLGGDGIMIGSPSSDDKPAAEHNTIENCTIDRCGQTYYGAVGVWVGMSVDTSVRNNEIRDLPYTGVSVGWRWDDSPTICRGHQIRENNIHNVMLILSDGGGIYTLGRQPGMALADNVIHDIPVNAGRAESNGIFMDEGSTDIRVEGNTIYHVARSPIRFNRAGKNILAGNTLASALGTPTFQYTGTNPSDMTYTDNLEIADADWVPPADDAAVKKAGPQPQH